MPAEDLVRSASEQDLVGGEVNLARDLAHHLVPVADRPAAVLEPSVAILVGPAGRLHHAVEGHERRHHQLSHLRLLVVAVTGAIAVSDRFVESDRIVPENSSPTAPELLEPLVILLAWGT